MKVSDLKNYRMHEQRLGKTIRKSVKWMKLMVCMKLAIVYKFVRIAGAGRSSMKIGRAHV